jgi:hypothetical protein
LEGNPGGRKGYPAYPRRSRGNPSRRRGIPFHKKEVESYGISPITGEKGGIPEEEDKSQEK